MRASLAFAAMMLLAGPTAAHAAPPVGSTAPAVPSSSAATKTVEGVTVVGKPLPTKECSSRDRDCILTVVAELKKLYPEQLKRLCFQRKMRAMRNSTLFDDADPASPEAPQMVTSFGLAEPLVIACAPDKK